MAGALQAAGRAPIVGQTTFGTGTVLNAFTLSDGSVVNLAVQRRLTPTGELIFGKGITPDDAVSLGPDDVPIEPVDLREMSPDQLPTITDRQLLAALALLGGPQLVSPSPTP
jgi:carboxyl-terminal processing protease